MKYARLFLFMLVPCLAGLLSVLEGKDANWDFLNYRWYSPYAFLNGRLALDMLVSGHATFYNPFLELPFYLLATHVPAIVAGFAVAVVDGACFIPLFLITERVLRIENEKARFAVAAIVALAGLTGGGALGQIGVISWDMALGLFSLGSMAVLVGRDGMALGATPQETWRRLLLAGFLAGAAAGLKLTAAVFPFGIAIGLFVTSAPSWKDRFLKTIVFSVGGALGIAVFGGYWMAKLYMAYDSPTLPYFNNLFQSPYAVTGDNRDATFLPGDVHTALLFPFLFTLNSRRVAEYNFRDTHIAFGFIMIALAIVAAYAGRKRDRAVLTNGRSAAFLFVAFFVIFAAWEKLFSIYRYIIPLEMMGAVIVAVGVARLPLSRRTMPVAVIVAMVVMGCLVQAGFKRLPWDSGPYVAVHLPVPISDDAMVLMPGMSPLGYIVTSLPPSVPAIRVGSYLATGDAFAPLMASRIAAQKGPIFVIYDPGETAGVEPTLAQFDLIADKNSCAPVTSNVANPMTLCKVSRP